MKFNWWLICLKCCFIMIYDEIRLEFVNHQTTKLVIDSSFSKLIAFAYVGIVFVLLNKILPKRIARHYFNCDLFAINSFVHFSYSEFLSNDPHIE